MIDENMLKLAEIRNSYSLKNYGYLNLHECALLKYDELCLDIIKENRKLKKQLEVGKEQYNDLVEEKEKIQEQLSSNTLQFEKQQKEFIEWLEDKINFWKDKIFENAITENDWTLTLWRNKLGILEEVLSKYKEIYKLLEILDIDKYAERINDDPGYDDLEPIEFREHINHVKEQMMKDVDKGE